MQITISIPEDIGNQLQQNWENLPQKVLESLAIEAYRNRIMNVVQIQQLLKFSSLSETEQFLQQSRIYVGFPKESLVENPPQKTLNDAVKELQKICNELGDKQGAIDDYTQAIKINPNYAQAYYGRGFVRNELRDKQGAIDDYNQAIKINPKK